MSDLRAAVREAIEIAEDKQASERGRLAAVHATLTKALADAEFAPLWYRWLGAALIFGGTMLGYLAGRSGW